MAGLLHNVIGEEGTIVGFNEREAIRSRMEMIADEKNILYDRLQKLDQEFTFYMDRLREMDENSGTGNTTAGIGADQAVHASGRRSKKQRGPYDFDALKEGLRNLHAKHRQKRQETGIINASPDHRKRGKQYNLKEVANIIEQLLKEHGEPMEVHRLREILAERGYVWRHFLPTLQNIMKYSKHLEKPYRGFIAYVESPGSEQHEGTENAEVQETGAEAVLSETVKAAADEVPDTAVASGGEDRNESIR